MLSFFDPLGGQRLEIDAGVRGPGSGPSAQSHCSGRKIHSDLHSDVSFILNVTNPEMTFLEQPWGFILGIVQFHCSPLHSKKTESKNTFLNSFHNFVLKNLLGVSPSPHEPGPARAFLTVCSQSGSETPPMLRARSTATTRTSHEGVASTH